MNEGSGNEVGAQVKGTADAVTFCSSGELGWTADGKSGPAPIIQAGSTFDLGMLGDFDRDQRFSYGAWVKTADAKTSAAIFARMDESAAYRGWDLWQNGNSFSVHLIDSWPENSIKVTTKGSVVTPGKWQHVFATYDGSGQPAGVKIYVDGKSQELQVDSKTLKPDASFRTQTPMRIGQRSSGAIFDGGSLQDLRIYDRSLSSDDVQSLAAFPELASFLNTAADERTKKQEQPIFDWYLDTQDEQYAALARQVVDLEAEKEAIRTRSPLTHIQEEKKDSAPMAFILMRGEYDRPGDQVEAATPAALHPLAEDAPKNRLGLARGWLIPRTP